MNERDRLLARIVVDESGCWIWHGHCDRHGYGRCGRGLAHRASYETFVGEIPAGLQLDHLCRVRNCVNPEHLEPVTMLENIRRGFNANKTHCIHGHEFTPENTYRKPKTTARNCRACVAEHARRYRARLRLANS